MQNSIFSKVPKCSFTTFQVWGTYIFYNITKYIMYYWIWSGPDQNQSSLQDDIVTMLFNIEPYTYTTRTTYIQHSNTYIIVLVKHVYSCIVLILAFGLHSGLEYEKSVLPQKRLNIKVFLIFFCEGLFSRVMKIFLKNCWFHQFEDIVNSWTLHKFSMFKPSVEITTVSFCTIHFDHCSPPNQHAQ